MAVPLHVHAPVPDGTRTPRLWLRPLRATDVDLDYDAVMSSRERLRRWSQSDWPAEGFTHAENLADLERHEREHLERVAYTFTVLDPQGARCLGCVYLTAPRTEVEALLPNAANAVNVGFWVRADEPSADLDAHLLATLLEWLTRAWRFDHVAFTVARDDHRQQDLLRSAGLEPLGSCVLAGGRSCRVYGAALARDA